MTADPPDLDLSRFRHDLRTPVNAILGYAELLLEDGDDLPPDLLAGLTDLHELGRQLLATIAGFQPAGSGSDVGAVVAAARRTLLPAAARVESRAAELAARADAGGWPVAAPDIRRIAAAGEALRDFLSAAVPPAGRGPIPTVDASFRPNGDSVVAAAPGHVLVVDDDPANRHLLARNLQKQGHAFVLAPDGPTALELIAACPFDVILLDMVMPGMGGYEVLTRIKRDPARRHTPVVVVSALDELDGVVQCLEAGAEDYLPKPCNPVLLKARVGVCLEKKRLRDLELEYLRQVETVTAAAAAVEAGTYDPEQLAPVAARPDALGALARVFGHMACEVRAREERLRQEVLQLRVEIDETRKAREVADVTETDYFRELQEKAAALRARRVRGTDG